MRELERNFGLLDYKREKTKKKKTKGKVGWNIIGTEKKAGNAPGREGGGGRSWSGKEKIKKVVTFVEYIKHIYIND